MTSAKLSRIDARHSKLVAFLRAVFRECEDLRAFLSHQNCVLELGREAAVLSAHGPSVGLVDLGFPNPLVEHWFDRQASAGADDGFAGLQIGEVWNTRLLMETATDAVALEFANDLVALIFGKPIDGSADIDDAAEGLDGSDTDPHRVERGLHQAFRLRRDVPDEKCFRRISVPASNNGCEIEIDDVSVFQNLIAGDAVADDFVDAGTNCVRKTVVAEAGRGMTVLDRVAVGQLVDFASGHASSDMRSKEVHDFGVETTGGSEGIAIDASGIDGNLGQRTGLGTKQSASERIHKITCVQCRVGKKRAGIVVRQGRLRNLVGKAAFRVMTRRFPINLRHSSTIRADKLVFLIHQIYKPLRLEIDTLRNQKKEPPECLGQTQNYRQEGSL